MNAAETKTWRTLNVNEYVRVQLTDHGKAVYRDNYVKLGLLALGEPSPIEEDAEGWSEWQLWRLMQEFGPAVGMGRDMVFKTSIQVAEENLT